MTHTTLPAESTDGATTHHYRIGPVAVTLRSCVPELTRDYHALYARYEVASGPPDALGIDVIARRSWRTGRRHYHISAQGEETYTVRRKTQILAHVEGAINVLIARHLPRYLLIHAAVMSRDGVGVICPGPPTTGKSTLATALLARGWSYLSDEFALIDPATRRLIPYPKALSIKSGAFEVTQRLGLPLNGGPISQRGPKGWIRSLDPYRVRRDAVGDSCPVGAIVFPKFGGGAPPAIEPMSRARTVFELTHYCFNLLAYRARAPEVLTELVREARCYRLCTGELEATCTLVESHCRDLGRRRIAHAG